MEISALNFNLKLIGVVAFKCVQDIYGILCLGMCTILALVGYTALYADRTRVMRATEISAFIYLFVSLICLSWCDNYQFYNGLKLLLRGKAFIDCYSSLTTSNVQLKNMSTCK